MIRDNSPEQISERRALGWAALIATAAIWYIVEPVALGILLGTLLAFMMQPLFGRVQRRFGTPLASTLTVIATSVVVTGLLIGLTWMLFSKGTVHMGELIAALGPDAPGGGALSTVSRWAERVGIAPEDLPGKAREMAGVAAARVAVGASAVITVGAGSLLALFFMMLAMHFVLRNPALVVRVAKETLPLKPEWTTSLAGEFRRVGRATLLGTLVTGLAQGVLATVGFWVSGVPDPIFYGAATAVASLVPAIGTLLVWVPVGVVMILTGHPIGGTVVLTWGALVVVGVSDYVIRPRLIGTDSELPPLVTFAALFGGVEVFGLRGLIVGPLVMSLAIAVLRIYANEARERREAGA